MIRPPCGVCLRICANAARAHSTAPVRFTSRTARQSSSVISSIGFGRDPRPALLNSASSLPILATASVNTASTSPGLVTSAGKTRPPPPSFAVSSSASRLRPTRATSQPAEKRQRSCAADAAARAGVRMDCMPDLTRLPDTAGYLPNRLKRKLRTFATGRNNRTGVSAAALLADSGVLAYWRGLAVSNFNVRASHETHKPHHRRAGVHAALEL